jgi:hypothetical protein
MKWLLFLMAAFALTLSAADVSGTLKGTAQTQNGTVERTFIFKVDGDKLTGKTSSSMMGESPITDGKVDGDNISFTITVNFQGNELKLNYKGKVISNNEIKFTVDAAGETIEYTAKRTSS